MDRTYMTYRLTPNSAVFFGLELETWNLKPPLLQAFRQRSMLRSFGVHCEVAVVEDLVHGKVFPVYLRR
jgi:hypothetical protein